MRFLRDTRAQSIQIGAVLLFGILIILLSTWQAFVVPNQNEEIEFNHNQDVQKQMTELRTTVSSMPEAKTTRSATVDLGIRYPSRAIFRNPPPVSGSLETDGTTEPSINVSITNATAVSDSDIGTADFWNGTTRSYQTGSIQYRSSYNEYRNAPTTIYEHSILYNRFEREGQQLPITEQALISDGRISLVAVNGSLSETRVESTSVDFEPISTQTKEVRVEPAASDQPITLELPTKLNESQWDNLVGPDHNVTRVEGVFPDSDRSLIRITLDGSRDSYRIQLAKIGVGTGTTGTDSTYIVGTDGDGGDVTSGARHSFTVEVRDDFNKPLQGVEVDGAIEDDTGNNISGQTLTATRDGSKTGPDGTLSFRYDTSDLDLDPGEEKTVFGNFSFLGGDTPQQYVALELTVTEPAQSIGGEFVAGPSVTNISENETLIQGESYTLNATVSSIGDGDPLRSGTPIQNVTYTAVSETGVERSGIVQDYDPDLSNRLEEPETQINTSGWEEGDHNLTITAQDASGRTTTVNGPTITIVTGTQADTVERVSGSVDVGGNQRPRFDINVTTGDVTLESAALLTRNNLSGVGAKSTGQESNVIVDGTESSSASTSDGSFAYSFGGLTLAASDGDVGVEFDQLDTPIKNFESTTDTANSDLVLSLKFDDGSVKEFHFDGELDN